ncbi:MAG: FtsX-like permease family protein, partial [Saprospiraceae bacterium]|nr:FtsX-like permease family protein [Saprospiraceae bacterium]
GDASSALDGPKSLVITKSLAEKLFGSASNAVGKIVAYDNQDGFMVTGVVDLGNRLTHLQYDLFSRITWYSESFTGNNRATYVKLNRHTRVPELEDKITSLMRTLIEQEYATANYTPTASEFAAWKLQPVASVHLQSSQFGWISDSGGNVRHIYIFLVIGLLVLSVAMINYINLATSRAIKRSKEVGVRKVTGASRGQLLIQFTIEAVLQSLVALVIAVVLAQLLLPLFGLITQRELALFDQGNALILVPAVVLAILVGMIAGYYPAVQVSSYQPVRALKGSTTGRTSRLPLRKVLVSGQFVISIALLAIMAIVYRQIHYMQDHDLRFSPDQVLVVPLNAASSQHAVANLRDQFTAIPGVQHLTTVSRIPGIQFPDWGMLIQGQTENVFPRVMFTDHELLNTLDIDLVEGRFFDPAIAADTLTHFVINEQYAHEYGLADPVGARIKFTYDSLYGEIIGVVENFHFQGLANPVRPLVIGAMHNRWYAAIKLSTGDLDRTLNEIKTLWAAVEPAHPMRYSFLDERFNTQYVEQERFGKTLMYAAVLTIF